MAVDQSNMLGVLDNFPQQCKEALSLPQGIFVKGEIKNIIVCGMGGSSIGGDILRSYMRDSKFPVFVHRDYSLPKFVDKNSLVFLVSYSGNTEETLSAFDEAERRGAHLIAVTSGGKLGSMCKQVIKIPQGIQPRAALGYLFFPMLGVLFNSKIADVKNSELNEMLALLNEKDAIKAAAEKLAKEIDGKTPIIYSSELLAPAAYRFKTQINENAKYPAFHNVFPEMDHNEINAFGKSMERERFIAVMIRDANDNSRIIKRMDLTKQVMEQRIDVQELNVKGNSLLARMFYAIYFGDFTSYYLAIRQRTDPTPVEVIEWLKKKLG